MLYFFRIARKGRRGHSAVSYLGTNSGRMNIHVHNLCWRQCYKFSTEVNTCICTCFPSRHCPPRCQTGNRSMCAVKGVVQSWAVSGCHPPLRQWPLQLLPSGGLESLPSQPQLTSKQNELSSPLSSKDNLENVKGV